MEVTLSDDQEFFRETTRRFLTDKVRPDDLRELKSNRGGFAADYWRRGAELGWTSLVVSEEHGGGSISGQGVVDLTIVADAFGRHAAPGPLIATNIVASALSASGTDEQRDAHLNDIVAGEKVAAWCHSEPPRGALDALDLAARSDGDDLLLTGTKAPVEAGAEADLLLVTAKSTDGPTQVLVDPAAAGVTVTPLTGVDMSRRWASVEFDDVRVDEGSVVGTVGGAAGDIERQQNLALTLQVAEMVGAAERAFEITVEWAFDRYTFGRPLASYQALKHRFANMKVWLEASHALGAAAAREICSGDERASETVSIAKAYAGEFLTELAQECVQMHGGIGLTSEHDLHLYFRRLVGDRATYGTPAEHRRRVGAHHAGLRAGSEAA